MHCTQCNFHSVFLNTNLQEVQWIHNFVGLLHGAPITLHIQIPTSHFAQLDCGNVMIIRLQPEEPLVVMQQQAYFICVVPAKLLDKSKAAGMFPFAYKQAIHGHHFLSLSHVFSCLKWMLAAVSTHSQTASSKSSGAFFTEMFAWAESRSLSPWGAPSVTNQMWTEKYINTMKTTRTQLVVALNKNVYPATKPIVWGLNKPAVFLFNFIVWLHVCVWFCLLHDGLQWWNDILYQFRVFSQGWWR